MKATKEFFLVLALMTAGIFNIPSASAFGEGAAVILPGTSPVPLVLDPIEVPHRIPRKEHPDVIRPMAVNITVDYKPNGSTGYWGDTCLTWPAAAQTAFNYAVGIWEAYLDISVPIVIEACWSNMVSGSILGFGGGSISSNFSGAPLTNTFYPIALANQFHGSDLNGSTVEIASVFNSARTNWYFGIDGNPGTGNIDFVSVVLHEICHGLGFLGTMDYDDGIVNIYSGNDVECNGTNGYGCWGWGTGKPAAYDLFAVDNLGRGLINTAYFGNPSTSLGTQLKSGNVFFNGPNAVAANSGSNAELYAPATWSPGSSYGHLDQIFNGTANALMTYSISTNEADHDPGPVTLGILEDIGWTIISIDSTPPGAPISLTATPGSWTNINDFSINWTDPSEPSGIAGAWYKVGSVPTTDTDGSYTTSKPFNTAATTEGGQTIYVWLQDGAGNRSYENRSSTTLYYDGTAPTDGTLTATKGNGTVSLSWDPAYDTGGSGLASSNRYMVKQNSGIAPDAQCTNGTQVYLGPGTSTTATGLTNGQTYYFRVCAYDTAGNISQGATASSTLTVDVQFNSSPTGRALIIDSSSYSAPWPTTWVTASTHSVNVDSPQTDGTPGKQYVFSSWSDGGAQGHNVTPLVDNTYTAMFLTQYYVTTNAGINGTIAPDCSAGCWYNSGTPLQLTAIPDSGYVLSSWSGHCAGTDLTTTLTLDGPMDCSASFTACGDMPVQNSRTNATFDFISGTSNAYASAETGDTLWLIATSFGETLDFDRSPEITITLQGGYSCGYTGPSSLSVISGPVTVTSGTIIMDRIVIR